jgi:hypothetical protein
MPPTQRTASGESDAIRIASLETKWDAAIPQIEAALPAIQDAVATVNRFRWAIGIFGVAAITAALKVLSIIDGSVYRGEQHEARLQALEERQQSGADALHTVSVRLERISTQIESLQQIVVEQRDELRRSRAARP